MNDIEIWHSAIGKTARVSAKALPAHLAAGWIRVDDEPAEPADSIPSPDGDPYPVIPEGDSETP